MRIARKVYMSIFTTMFILITCVATTFAWVGMFTTSTLGSFDLNLKVVDVDDVDYYLTISSSGNPNTFSDSVSIIDIKRQILENMGFDTSSYLDEGIEQLFNSKSIMEPLTTDKNLSAFYAMVNLKNRKPFLKLNSSFYKFDLYLSVDTPEGIAGMTQEEVDALTINANVFFDNISEALTGTLSTGSLINANPFDTIPSNSRYASLNEVNANFRNITINTKNATRIAFQIYNPKPITYNYDEEDSPIRTIIFQGGKQDPSIENGLYDLGGILPEEYNLALKEINTIYDINVDLDTLFVDANNDGTISNDEKISYIGAEERFQNNIDLEMIEENNKIWQSPSVISETNYLGVQNTGSGGVQTKIKISVYFWYEGFDADCLRLIDFKPTSLSIVFASDKNDS